MEAYSASEYIDMLLIYGECRKNAREAAREYAARYPNRRHPERKLFSAIERRGRETGSVVPEQRREGPAQHAIQEEERVLENVLENPRTSIRRSALELGVSRSTVHRVLKKNAFHPYHDMPCQELLAPDMRSRIEFSRWFLDAELSENILWTDESTFNRTGAVNFHNTHSWATENPHNVRPHHFQTQFSVNVWAGMIGSHIVGPYFLPQRVNGEAFLDFLENSLFGLMEDLPLGVRRGAWYQMDGCPAHYTRNVREWMDQRFPRRWIGRGGTVSWPPRSPDLTPLDFYLWGNVKRLCYDTVVNTREELMERITTAFDQLKLNPQEVERATSSVGQRCRNCIQSGGIHIENL